METCIYKNCKSFNILGCPLYEPCDTMEEISVKDFAKIIKVDTAEVTPQKIEDCRLHSGNFNQQTVYDKKITSIMFIKN